MQEKDGENFLRLASKEDNPEREVEIRNIFRDSASSKFKKHTVRDPCEVNKFDTFKIVFPEEEEFLEITFCVDTFAFMQQILESLRKAQDFIAKVKH